MRKTLGYVMLVVACLAWVAILLLPFLGISMAAAAAFTTGLIITGEVTFFAGIALLGKEAWQKIKAIFVESSVPERNLKAVQEASRAQGWDVQIGGQLYSDAMGDAGTFEGTYIGMVTANIDTIVGALGDENASGLSSRLNCSVP